MSDTYNIEQTILASVLNSEIEASLEKGYFTTQFHQKLVIGINRLIELNKMVDFELLRNNFIKVNQWSFKEDDMLIDIMVNTTPFGSQALFNSYLEVLKESFLNRLAHRIAS